MRVFGGFILCLILVGVVSAGTQLTDSQTVSLKDTAVNISAGSVAFSDIKNNIFLSTTTEVDGIKFEPQIITTDKDAVVYTDGKDAVSDYTIKMEYQYDGFRLKETITLKEDKVLKFTLYLDENSKLISFPDGDWRVVNKWNGNTMDGVTLERPFGIDANNRPIVMDYTYENEVLSLVYDKTNITYPLIIDPTWVSFKSHWIDNTTVSTQTIEMWNATGTVNWSCPTGVSSVWYLVIGGGGQAGGGGTMGGGGAGGLLNGTLAVTDGTNYTILVGAGGAGSVGINGYNSTFSTINASGGGGGANTSAGHWGGSGGGGSGNGGDGIGGNPITGQGFGGGNGLHDEGGGGGGGAGVNGSTGVSGVGGKGGNGTQVNITGLLTWYAGGGGGYGDGVGGYGGGGAGVFGVTGLGTNGLGGGGGGSSIYSYGGSGLVILRYTTPPPNSSFTVNTTGGIMPIVVSFTDTSTISGTSWSWSFKNITPGNNTFTQFSTSQNPIYTFNAGNFSIRLNSTNSGGTNTSTQVTYINVSNPGMPVSNFTTNVTSGARPLAVAFTDNTTQYTTSWVWEFNNITGNATWVTFSTARNSSWVFNPGNYSIRHTAANIIGSNVSTRKVILNVSDTLAPVASWYSNITNGTVPQTVQFTDTSINTPTSWMWNFTNITGGGASTQFSTSQHPNKTFTVSANYLINLIVYNVYGNTSASGWVNLTTPPCSFIVSESSGLYPLDVTFNDTSNWINGTNWTWWFGDGTYAIATTPAANVTQNVTHTYFSPGTYFPTMMIHNNTYTGYADSPIVITVSGTNQLFATIHTTTFTYSDWSGIPISGINVTILALNSTTPQEWAFSLFNINLGATPIDSTSLTGLTDSSGSVTFVTLQTSYYQVRASKPSLNINQIDYLSGANEHQTITIWAEQQRIAPFDYQNTFWQAPAAAGNITLGLNYTGTGTYSTNVTYYIMNQSKAVLYQQSVTNTSAITFSHEVVPVQGEVYYWGVKVNSSGYGNIIQEQQFIRFNNSQWLINPMKAADGDTVATAIYTWSSVALIILVAAVSGRRNLKQGGVITAGLGVFMQYVGWLPVPSLLVYAAFALSILFYIRFAEEESTS